MLSWKQVDASDPLQIPRAAAALDVGLWGGTGTSGLRWAEGSRHYFWQVSVKYLDLEYLFL